MPEQSPEHWYGSLAMTVAYAATSPNPKDILKPALRRFLAAHPPGHELGDYIRTTVKELKT